MLTRPGKSPDPPSPAEPSRARIVAAARRHFFAHGFRNVTMEDLAREMGMSKKTLYASFRSKTDLLEAVLVAKLAAVDADLARITAEPIGDFSAALGQLLACVHEHTGEIQPALVRDMEREAPELFQVVEGRRREVIRRHFGKVLGVGRKSGVLRKGISAQLVLEILLGATQAIMNPPKLTELGLTPQAAFAGILAVILKGALATPEATKL